MVMAVSAKISAAMKAANMLQAAVPSRSVARVVPALPPTAKDGWAFSKTAEGKSLAAAVKTAAWHNLQNEHIHSDAPLHIAGMKAHAERPVKFATWRAKHSDDLEKAHAAVLELAGASKEIRSAVTTKKPRSKVLVIADARSS
jgi:hypothetical protein